MQKVLISAGHGGEVGAVSNGTNEHAEVVAVVKKCFQYLQGNTSFTTIMVPLEYTLAQRIQYVNQVATEKDLLIEIHMNSAPNIKTNGAEVYYYSGENACQQAAKRMVANYSTFSGVANAGEHRDTEVRMGRLGIIRDTKPLAFLIETGYITNVEDLVKVRNKAAYAIAQMILAHLGQPLMETIVAPPLPTVPTVTDPHKIAVDWAKTVGVSNGDRPKEAATREEVMHLLYNFAKFLNKL